MIREGDEISGVVVRVLHRRSDRSIIGLLVDVGATGFAPRPLLPTTHLAKQVEDLESLHFDGVVLKVDDTRTRDAVVVVKPTRFYPPPLEAEEPLWRNVDADYLQILLDNLRSLVPINDTERYLGVENARSILAAIFKRDLGDDPADWESFIRDLDSA